MDTDVRFWEITEARDCSDVLEKLLDNHGHSEFE